MKTLSLNAKLWLLALVSLVSLVMVGVSGMFGTSSLNSIFAEYRGVARMQKGVAGVSENLLLARLDAMKYRVLRDSTFLDAAYARFADIDVSLDELREITADPLLRRKLNAIAIPADNYAQALNRARSLTDFAAQEAVFADELDIIGPELARELVSFGKSLKKIQDRLGPEGAARAQQIQILTFALFIGAFLVAGAGTFYVRKSTVTQINALRQAMQAVEQSDKYTTKIPCRSVKGSIGAMAVSLAAMQDSLRKRKDEMVALHKREKDAEKARLEDEARRRAKQEEDDRIATERQRTEQQNLRRALAEQFEQSIDASIATVSNAGTRLLGVSEVLTSAAMDTENGSVVASDETKNTSQNVNEVSTATRQMSSSISEINQQVRSVQNVVQKAVKQSQKAAATVQDLERASERISDVLLVITDIAEQTNLLALNATIEAARAGEAGRGFAVVATEVKALAGQSSKAADEISIEVERVQDATRSAVSVLGDISSTIKNIDTVTVSVTSAVEEQSAATNEISRAAESAASSTAEVSSIVSDVASTAAKTQSMSTDVQRAANDVATETGRLREAAMQFIDKMKVG